MRDFEHRRCVEDVVCPHAPLRVFTKCKRSRYVKVGGLSKCKRSRHVKVRGFLYALPLPSIVAISTSESSDLSTFSRLVKSAFAVSRDVRQVTPVSMDVRRMRNPS